MLGTLFVAGIAPAPAGERCERRSGCTGSLSPESIFIRAIRCLSGNAFFDALFMGNGCKNSSLARKPPRRIFT
jgi:hypothetical protein